MRYKIIVAILLLLLCSNFCLAQANSEECPIPPPQSSGPGGDAPDENYSFNQGITSIGINYIFDNPRVAVFNRGSKDFCFSLLNRIGNGFISVNERFNYSAITNKVDVIVIPTGGLFGLENDTVFKASLQEYVRQGGTILAFTQQFGEQIDKVVPVPEGQSLRSYGFREDQSCSGAAGYFKQMHPALAAMDYQQVSINVDGYFGTYPGNATVILRRISNQQPCLISYPYGNGTVILTSMYSDWGLAHSQASGEELRLVRDLITFAKNPNLPIPMYNLTTNPHPDISLNVTVKNENETAAVKSKIKVYTPDRAVLLYETEAALALAAGGEGVVPVSFNLGATLTQMQYGLCHTDYELYDADGNLLQPATEADSGRFGVYRTPANYNSNRTLSTWLTVANENVFWDEPVTFTLHVQNNTAKTVNPSFEIQRTHDGYVPLFAMEVPANSIAEKTFTYDHRGAVRFWVQAPGVSSTISKGIQVIYPSLQNNVQTPSSQIRFGDAINYTINSTNTTGKAIAGSVAVKLLRDEQEIETLYSAAHDYGNGETFAYSGSYTSANPLAPGNYKLKLAVTTIDGKTFYSYAPFSYIRSDVNIQLGKIPEAYTINFSTNRYGLTPGQTYSVNFK